MNRNVKDYLILKGDFDFTIPWITLRLGVPGAPEPKMYPRSGYFLVNNKAKISKQFLPF